VTWVGVLVQTGFCTAREKAKVSFAEPTNSTNLFTRAGLLLVHRRRAALSTHYEQVEQVAAPPAHSSSAHAQLGSQ
jgi:hypothetical protein